MKNAEMVLGRRREEKEQRLIESYLIIRNSFAVNKKLKIKTVYFIFRLNIQGWLSSASNEAFWTLSLHMFFTASCV